MNPEPDAGADTRPDAFVRGLFADIAGVYDLLNQVFSLGLHHTWRHEAACWVRATGAREVLDLATGSGDFALELQRQGLRVTGADFCLPMLRQAAAKGLRPLVQASALRLPFADGAFDAVTIGFGYRNFSQRCTALTDILRVLRPGGGLLLLEFTQPWRCLRPLYTCYLHALMPAAARFFASRASAYGYLAETIRGFPDVETLAADLRAAGFDPVTWRQRTLGIVALHRAVKPTGTPR